MNFLRKEIGRFSVLTKTGKLKNVIVSQNVETHYGKDHAFTGKFLNLDTINGPPVELSNRINVFRLHDGTVLRRR